MQPDDEDLKKIASMLVEIKDDLSSGKAENPFAVPVGYFDSLNAEVMKKIESLPDFESVSSENPFQVPAGYFESLPTIIQQRIVENKSKKISIGEWIAEVFSQPAPKYALAFASIILVIVFSTKYFTRTVKVDYVDQQIPDSEQLDAFYLQQVDESTLAEVYSEEFTATTTTDSQNQGIENYLLDNDIDINSITEQL